MASNGSATSISFLGASEAVTGGRPIRVTSLRWPPSGTGNTGSGGERTDSDDFCAREPSVPECIFIYRVAGSPPTASPASPTCDAYPLRPRRTCRVLQLVYHSHYDADSIGNTTSESWAPAGGRATARCCRRKAPPQPAPGVPFWRVEAAGGTLMPCIPQPLGRWRSSGIPERDRGRAPWRLAPRRCADAV